ncbi:MAG: MoxR family ATPase [Verrucomicrobiales bacterium]
MNSHHEKLDALQQLLNERVLGTDDASFFLLIALLANGHVLIQGAPGIGKTTLAKTLADAVDCRFSRIQFTPDLLPSDILGYSMYRQGSDSFEFIGGPIFNNIVLADEINRTSPRIQSALLEAMNEHQVSIDGETHPLPAPFMVIATQNNLYASGTFPLPEPQLDRFLVSIEMRLPTPEKQIEILNLHAAGVDNDSVPVRKILTSADIIAMQKEVLKVGVLGKVQGYIVGICESARNNDGLWSGLSARASIALMRASQAAAFLDGRDVVYPDDVKRVTPAVLGHRLHSRSSTNLASSRSAVSEVLMATPVP